MAGIPVKGKFRRKFWKKGNSGVGPVLRSLDKFPVLVRHWFKKMFYVPFRSGFGFIVNFEKKNGRKISIVIN